MIDKNTLLHLSLIDGIGPVTIKKLLDALPVNTGIADLYHFLVSDVMSQFLVTRLVAQKIVTGLRDKELLDKELALIKKYDIQFAVLGDKDYPEMLSHIHAPPAVLYWCGQPVFNEQKTIAVIGSRIAHRYGENVIDQFVPELIDNDWVIVSGGAIGADSMAHRATVQAGGKTVVVLGSGLLCPYPSSNRKLFDSIVNCGGALVSAFPLMTQARPGNFPARNRIIAGLSRGCLVVQAAKKSGARITAQFALQQGREVFAVPGPIDDPLSEGCHGLIQEGAKLVGSVDDILVEFDLLFGSMQKNVKSVKVEKNFEKRRSVPLPVVSKSENIRVKQKKISKRESGVKGNIFDICSQPSTADQIALELNVDLEQLHELLFDMQLSGSLTQNFAGLWERA